MGEREELERAIRRSQGTTSAFILLNGLVVLLMPDAYQSVRHFVSGICLASMFWSAREYRGLKRRLDAVASA